MSKDKIDDYMLTALGYGFQAWCSDKCESPIEELFARALVCRFYMNRMWRFEGHERTIEAVFQIEALVRQQVNVDRYRPDFLIEVRHDGGAFSVIVECDGHDFHDRTPAQAQRDKARDRALQMLGYRVFRFTGSEIYRDPISCVLEVEDFIIGECQKGAAQK